MIRAYSAKELIQRKFKLLPFTGDWLGLVGSPELSGSWLIWGGSTSGKTSFALQLCKYLSTFGSVAYNSLEEGVSESLRLALIRTSMDEAKNVVILDKEPIEELITRLKKHKSQRIVIIDSLQYTGLDLLEYKSLISEFPTKLFIFISHADGREPDGKLAKRVRYDSNVKIYVDGYQATAHSRYGGGKTYTVWKEGAANCWGADNK